MADTRSSRATSRDTTFGTATVEPLKLRINGSGPAAAGAQVNVNGAGGDVESLDDLKRSLKEGQRRNERLQDQVDCQSLPISSNLLSQLIRVSLPRSFDFSPLNPRNLSPILTPNPPLPSTPPRPLQINLRSFLKRYTRPFGSPLTFELEWEREGR